MKLNGHKIDTTSLEIDGVDPKDYPDFCDTYFSHAEYENGIPLTNAELEQLTNEYGETLNEMAFESLI